MSRQASRTPVRFPSGVNNAINGGNPAYNWNTYGAMDPTRYYSYLNDFTNYAAGDWTITDVGTDTRALTDGAGGRLLLTTGAAGTDSTFLQLPKLMFFPVVGTRHWFETKFQLDNATLSNFVVGLQSQDTTPLAVADGIYFIKASGAATVDFIVKAAAGSTTTNSAITSVAAATDITLGWHYDGQGNIDYFVNRVKAGTSVATNMPVVGLTVSFGVAASTAAARTANLDYIFVSQERAYPNSP